MKRCWRYHCAFRTGSRSWQGPASSFAAMASSDFKTLYRDDEVLVDRDGIPHFSGADPGLMREYRRRVLFAYANLEGEGDDAAKEARDLQKKQSRFAKKLLDALHGEAWKCCQELLDQTEKLREREGYKHIFKALQQIEKVTVIKKTEAFDSFFEKCHRKRGQSIDAFLRQRNQTWNELLDLTEGTSMSEDLRAYFLLKHVGLPREDRRQILLANQSNYTMEGIEQALRVSYYDVHEREKGPREWQPRAKKETYYKKKHYAHLAGVDEESSDGDDNETGEHYDLEDSYAVEEADGDQGEEEPLSDQGASGDDEIYDAYATMNKQRKGYKESRRRLKELQKSRGFFRGDVQGEFSVEERKASIAKEKQRTRCSACHKIGHWAGDAACSKSGKVGPKKFPKKGKGKGKANAYVVSEAPLFFSLDEALNEEDGFCNMVGEQDDPEPETQDPMQDADLDARRRRALARAEVETEAGLLSDSSYTVVSSVPPPMPSSDVQHKVTVTVEMEVSADQITVLQVPDFESIRPADLYKMRNFELAAECDAWGISTSGTKAQMLGRLERLFSGEPVAKKGHTKKFIQLKAFDVPQSAAQPVIPKMPPFSRPTSAAAKAKAYAYTLDGDALLSEPIRKAGYSQDPQPAGGKKGGTFRVSAASAGESSTVVPSVAEAKAVKDPRSGIPVPEGMGIGKTASWISCPACVQPMVLRRNSEDGGLFMGCSRFPKCRGTKKFTEVVGVVSTSGASGSGGSFSHHQ